jgi:hypothetical protein
VGDWKKYALEIIIEMSIFLCIHDILLNWISVKDTLYWLAIMWIVCEFFYMYGYSKRCPWSDSMASTCNSWWLCFTSHGYEDVKLILWAHVWHKAGPTQLEFYNIVLFLHMYVVSLNMRLSHVLKIWIYLLRDYQTLFLNCVVINVVWVCQEAYCEAWSLKMEFKPLYLREISLGSLSD